MSYQTIKLTVKSAIASVTLHRPEVRNAMNANMIQEITDVFNGLDQNQDVRVIVISGTGASFSTGMDLHSMKAYGQMSRDENIAASKNLQDMYTAVDQCSKAVIGKIHGHAFGGGFGLCTVCDIVIADTDTLFSLSEVLIGLIPAVIGPYVEKKIGHSHFRALGISGQRFDSQTAAQIGLIHYAVKGQELDEKTSAIINQLLQAGSQAIARFKNFCRDMNKANSAELLADQRASAEGQEGLTAFLEKRPPSWVK